MLFLIKGNEEFLRAEALKEVIANAKKQISGAEVSSLQASSISKGQIVASLGADLLSNGGICVVHSAEECSDDMIEDVCDLVANKNSLLFSSDCALVILHSGAVRGKRMITAIENATKTNKPDLVSILETKIPSKPAERANYIRTFVQTQFQKNGRKIDNAALEVLINSVDSSSLRFLNSLTEQLSNDATEDMKIIDRAFVENFFSKVASVEVWNISDAAIAGETEKALILFREAIASSTPSLLVVNSLAGKLREVIKATTYKNRGLSASEIGVQPWMIEKLAQIGRTRFSIQRLRDSFSALAEADFCAKGGSKDGGIWATEKAIIAISR